MIQDEKYDKLNKIPKDKDSKNLKKLYKFLFKRTNFIRQSLKKQAVSDTNFYIQFCFERV